LGQALTQIKAGRFDLPFSKTTVAKMEEREMRLMTLALTAGAALWITAPAVAAQLPTDAQCHALARQRGSAEEAGSRNHERFIAQCLAGRIPTQEVPGIPNAVRDLRVQSSDLCHELARNRGASEGSGSRNHERFIAQCMAGRVPRDAGQIRTATQELRKRSSEECHALAVQRAGGESSGSRNHERFIRDCMAGKVS
jgi:hypothetical protein